MSVQALVGQKCLLGGQCYCSAPVAATNNALLPEAGPLPYEDDHTGSSAEGTYRVALIEAFSSFGDPV
jgi:hypothetical protein